MFYATPALTAGAENFPCFPAHAVLLGSLSQVLADDDDDFKSLALIAEFIESYMVSRKPFQAPQRLLRRPHLRKVIRPSVLNSSVATTTPSRLRYEIVASSFDD